VADELIGTYIGKYQIRGLLGQGGMAEVYEAYHPGLQRKVALKILHRHLAAEEDVRERFRREAQMAASLRHPNIVQVYDFDVHEESFYMVMEYIGGGTLRDRLVKLAERGGLMPVETIVEIITALCVGLQYAHETGMVHRDIKPANVMFTDKGESVLTDFGIAFLAGASRLTLSGGSTGTPAYMSPEQARGKRGDERSDIYSLGVTLYQMATGHLPFEGETPYRLLMAHISDPPPPPRRLNPSLSPQVAAVIEKALHKDPDRRYQTPQEMADALRAAALGPAAKAPPPETIVSEAPRPVSGPETVAAPPERYTPPPEYYSPPPQYVSYPQQPAVAPQEEGSSLTLLALGGTTILILALVLLLLAGAGYYFLIGPGAGGGGGAPFDQAYSGPVELTVNAPVSGATVQVGEVVAVSGNARHDRGIVGVELWVDGALKETRANSNPTGQLFSFSFQWAATSPGNHQLALRAYDGDGQMGEKAVMVTVVGGTEEVTPTTQPPPEATPTSVEDVTATPPPLPPEPTATATPLPLPPEPTATVTPLPLPPEPTATRPLPPTNTPPLPKSPPVAQPGVFEDFETPKDWRRGDQPNGTFERSSEQAHGGSHSGKLAYNFPGGGNDFVVFSHEQALAGTPNQISAWVYGDGSGHFLNVWVKDNGGQTWQMSLGQVQHTGWQEMTAYLDPGQPWPSGHIGGPDNGAIDYPVSFLALVLDDVPDGYSGSGAIFIDDLASGAGAQPPPAATVAPELPSGVVIELRADHTELGPGECTTVRWDVEGVRAVFFEGNGVTGHGDQYVCPQGTTTYHLRVELTDGRQVERTLTIKIR
jgi:serine/threonine protein kinase